MTPKGIRIAFMSSRFEGTDGVSLETVKWVSVLEGMGHTCFFFAGASDWPTDRSYVVAEAHLAHPEILALNADLFDNHRRSPKTSQHIQALKDHLKDHLRRFTAAFQPQILIVENALSLPMNVPLGLALTEHIAETETPTIAHHHDFYWERERYSASTATDFLRAAFPPTLPSVHHVVINSFAGRQLAMRTGARSQLAPNVMDFDNPPPAPDTQSLGLRGALGIPPGELLLLQPTRIVPRKRIERAIEISRRLGLPATLLITHRAGDEGQSYADYLKEFAQMVGARVIFAADRVARARQQNANGQLTFSLADAYQQADLVTYPSAVEGFGNAFLESVFYQRPIMMADYEIFAVDIQPKGFRAITFGEFVGEAALREAREWLTNPAIVSEVVRANYEVARRHYSYRALEGRLAVLLNECLGA